MTKASTNASDAGNTDATAKRPTTALARKTPAPTRPGAGLSVPVDQAKSTSANKGREPSPKPSAKDTMAARRAAAEAKKKEQQEKKDEGSSLNSARRTANSTASTTNLPGLKRPATGLTQAKKPDTNNDSTNATRTPAPTKSRIGGLKPPSSIQKPSKLEEKKEEDKKEPVKPSPAKPLRNSAMPSGPKSAATDEVDDIYKENDPIGVSTEKRRGAGALTAVVPDKNSKSGKFFFALKVKGPSIVISD